MKLSDFKVGFPIASVWVGSMIGPSLLTGVYAMLYYTTYGAAWALIAPIFVIGFQVLVAAFSAEAVRRNKAYNFGALGKVFYGKLNPIFGLILSVYMICAFLVGGSSMTAGWAALMQDLIHAPVIPATILLAAIGIVLAIFGSGLVRKASSVMTIVLLIAMLILLGFSIFFNRGNWGSILSTGPVEGYTYHGGFVNILSLAFYGSNMCMYLCPVEDSLQTKSHTVAFAICSFVMLVIVSIIPSLIILPYAANVVNENVPFMWIVQNAFGKLSKVGTWIYSFSMIFAIISSMVPTLLAFISRFSDVIPQKGIFAKFSVRAFVSGVVFWVISFLVSLLGLKGVISTTYSYLGNATIVLIIVPALIIMPIQWHKQAKAARLP